jgi:hypothetical protein
MLIELSGVLWPRRVAVMALSIALGSSCMSSGLYQLRISAPASVRPGGISACGSVRMPSRPLPFSRLQLISLSTQSLSAVWLPMRTIVAELPVICSQILETLSTYRHRISDSEHYDRAGRVWLSRSNLRG